MPTKPPDIEAQITYLPTEAGGKTKPALRGYRTTHNFGHPDGMLNDAHHEYPGTGSVAPGATAQALIWFLVPEYQEKWLFDGLKFTVQEGSRVVGHGVVTKVINEKLRRVVWHPCHVCGYLVFGQPSGSYEICPICFWEDDIVQLAFPDLTGGANKVSLIEAQKNFVAHGVADPAFTNKVRTPVAQDLQDPFWRPLVQTADVYLHWDSPADNAKWQGVKDTGGFELYYWRPGYWLKDGCPTIT